MRILGAIINGVTGLFFYLTCLEFANLILKRTYLVSSPSIEMGVIYLGLTIGGFVAIHKIKIAIKSEEKKREDNE